MHTRREKGNLRNGAIKFVFVAVSVLLEVLLWIFVYLSSVKDYADVVAIIVRVVAFFVVLGIYSQRKTASIKMSWIVLIMVLPAFGVTLFVLIGLSGSTNRMRKRFEEIDGELFSYLKRDSRIREELERVNSSAASISRYIEEESNYPLYRSEGITYFSDSSEALEAQKEALRSAKKFIFMEYFAIEDAVSWASVEEILVEKIREGVEVRVFYDDVGSAGLTDIGFWKKLEAKGIKTRIFNPMVALFNLFLNNRDHRKLTIVDNVIGFTGGYNISDEYFNLTSPFGHWKDTGVRVEGSVVSAMTMTFLEMWNAVRSDDVDDEDVKRYICEGDSESELSLDSSGTEYGSESGFVQFYADNPIDKKPVGEDVYLSIINRAEKYIYIMSPYLIITDEMSRMLGLAAKRGVDVRIVTPGIPDKPIIYKLTRSYYHRLVCDGVKIYEYTPGFCHAKMFVSDDIMATCGTINLDYRSLYHHFEDGMFMVGTPAVMDIKKDFEDVFRVSCDVTEKYLTGRSAPLRFSQLLLRLFSALL